MYTHIYIYICICKGSALPSALGIGQRWVTQKQRALSAPDIRQTYNTLVAPASDASLVLMNNKDVQGPERNGNHARMLELHAQDFTRRKALVELHAQTTRAEECCASAMSSLVSMSFLLHLESHHMTLTNMNLQGNAVPEIAPASFGPQ